MKNTLKIYITAMDSNALRVAHNNLVRLYPVHKLLTGVLEFTEKVMWLNNSANEKLINCSDELFLQSNYQFNSWPPEYSTCTLAGC